LAAVERWEYRRVYVSWNDALGDWVCRFTDRDDIQGFDQVLNYFGQYGWELVTVEPQMWEALNYAEHNMGQVPPGESWSLQMYRTTGWAVGGYNCFSGGAHRTSIK
jgi:hypothetical protein